MSRLPADHPDRLRLADEVHARPPEPLEAPSRASYVAVLVDPADRTREFEHLVALFRGAGAEPPPDGITQYAAWLGPVRVKWERHGEFSSYTFIARGLSPQPFSEPPSSLLPEGWLQAIPGQTIVAAHAKLVTLETEAPDLAAIGELFEGQIVVGAGVGEGAGCAFTDFRLHEDGCTRFVLMDRSFTPRQAGRMLQRLFEIEAYRMLALLALPIARRQSPRIVAIESELSALTQGIAREDGREEELLQRLTALAAEVEREIAASQFRFGATRAYADLVRTRISELREVRIAGIQPIDEFMARRFMPAVATCQTVSQRLHDLSERVSQASSLLATRVGIARERQNQALLASMDRRAKLQLRLQQTVEGLSVAAIVYYMAGLIGYLAKGAKAAGAKLDPEITVGVAIPLIAGAFYLLIRRAKRRISASEHP